jgi:hypothetical protein
VLDQLDAIPLPEGVLEAAELGVSILRHAKSVEFAVREALGHVSPVEKLRAARDHQGQQSHVRKWDSKPSPMSVAPVQSEDNPDPTPPISGSDTNESKPDLAPSDIRLGSPTESLSEV